MASLRISASVDARIRLPASFPQGAAHTDSYLAIISLALAVAALVPILLPSTPVKRWTLTAAGLSLVVLIGIYQTYTEIVERQHVIAAKEQILLLLANTPGGMNFDQIYDNMYFPDFAVTNAALDELVWTSDRGVTGAIGRLDRKSAVAQYSTGADSPVVQRAPSARAERNLRNPLVEFDPVWSIRPCLIQG